MKTSDIFKVLIMLILSVLVVAVFCYFRVNVEMTLEQIIAKIESWNSNLLTAGFVVWSVAITFLIANKRRD